MCLQDEWERYCNMYTDTRSNMMLCFYICLLHRILLLHIVRLNEPTNVCLEKYTKAGYTGLLEHGSHVLAITKAFKEETLFGRRQLWTYTKLNHEFEMVSALRWKGWVEESMVVSWVKESMVRSWYTAIVVWWGLREIVTMLWCYCVCYWHLNGDKKNRIELKGNRKYVMFKQETT